MTEGERGRRERREWWSGKGSDLGSGEGSGKEEWQSGKMSGKGIGKWHEEGSGKGNGKGEWRREQTWRRRGAILARKWLNNCYLPNN